MIGTDEVRLRCLEVASQVLLGTRFQDPIYKGRVSQVAPVDITAFADSLIDWVGQKPPQDPATADAPRSDGRPAVQGSAKAAARA